jgi:2-oxoglutarate decarboxylase
MESADTSHVSDRRLLRGREAALAANMARSVSVPTATTIREFNAGPLMRWREASRAKGHSIPVVSALAYALVRTISDDVPHMRRRFESDEGGSWVVDDGVVNLGFAVDVSSSRGSSVLVPVVSNADALVFDELEARMMQLAEACRAGSISVDDLRGANVILTSTGKFGATSGIPRLPMGPGVIVAAGTITVPAGLEEIARSLPVSPTLTVTSTYDHRVIQGADSGRMLAGFARRLQDPAFLESMHCTEPADAATNGHDTGPVRRVTSLEFEFQHLADPARRSWWQEQVSTLAEPSTDLREWALRLLVEVGVFERFLQKQFLGLKTLSVEGLDSSLVALGHLASLCARDGGRLVEIGMAHRGRLSVMARLLDWDPEDLLREFLPETTAGRSDYVGDVRQHLGGWGAFQAPHGGTIRMQLEQNPSHLEFVSPVALGAARAAQDRLVEEGMSTGDARAAVLPVLLHGDAAFTGQGVVYETLNFAALQPYDVGGTVHIIQDNQLGFTATGSEIRSTHWPSDVVHGFGLPVVRVDADDVDGALAASSIAYAYRSTFGADVAIHVVGYRRHGHNETDEPRYTQPRYYAIVDSHPSVDVVFANRLAESDPGVLARVESMAADYRSRLVAALDAARIRNATSTATTCGVVSAIDRADSATLPLPWPDEEWVRKTLMDSYDVPEGFTVNGKLAKQFERKRAALEGAGLVDWAQAEYLALSLITERGVRFRLIGEDTERGTFSHRHLVLHDEVTGAKRLRVPGDQWGWTVANSPLTETATLAFEYGYARSDHQCLSIWEAQFGDFVNVAQVIIDQYISSGYQKWLRDGRLMMLLPHASEGAGPEHSSARLERFLQLAAGDNLRVLYPTRAAHLFSAIVEAALGPVCPTIVMTPKSLLRAELASSPLADFTAGRGFPPLLGFGAPMGEAKRVVLCTGKIGVNLEERGVAPGVRVVQLEQLAPFPVEALREELAGPVESVVWVQEEPATMGAWRYVAHELLRTGLRQTRLGYIGRPDASSPAEGYAADYKSEQERILSLATVDASPDVWLIP